MINSCCSECAVLGLHLNTILDTVEHTKSKSVLMRILPIKRPMIVKSCGNKCRKTAVEKATLKATLVNGVVDEKVLPPCGKPTLNVRHFYMAQWHTKTDGSYSYPILMVS